MLIPRITKIEILKIGEVLEKKQAAGGLYISIFDMSTRSKFKLTISLAQTPLTTPSLL
jgi:hypothetical protein